MGAEVVVQTLIKKVNLIAEIKHHYQDERLLVVLDAALKDFAPEVYAALNIRNPKRVWVCQAGEEAKTFSEYEKCMEQFLALGLHRGDHVLVIGGGAASDFGGFVAATLLRSLSWSVAPTTLLSMIDASIGGKTALNSRAGKNLIGAFHPPTQVLIDPSFLTTLSRDQYQSGLGELLKYTYLDRRIYELLKNEAVLNEIIFACAQYKQAVVERDLKESGERKFLNFGHTLGHAVEKVYQIPHGQAVLWGIYLILELYHPDKVAEFKAQVKRLGITYINPPWQGRDLDVHKIADYLDKDKKKVSGSALELVLVDEIGKPYCQREELSSLQQKLIEKKDVIKQFHL